MVKLVFCLRRRTDVSPVEFREHWRHRHAPLVQRHAATLGIRRYSQLHPVAAGGAADAVAAARGAPEPFDGVAEVWFDSLDDIVAPDPTGAARAAARALLDDERRFVDLALSPVWLFEEQPIVGPDAS